MLPPVVTKTVEGFSSALISFALIALAGFVVAAFLSNVVGGKSPAKRQAVFSVIGIVTLIVAVYYAKSKLGGNV